MYFVNFVLRKLMENIEEETDLPKQRKAQPVRSCLWGKLKMSGKMVKPVLMDQGGKAELSI